MAHKANVLDIFLRYDKDNSGFIDKSELRALIKDTCK